MVVVDTLGALGLHSFSYLACNLQGIVDCLTLPNPMLVDSDIEVRPEFEAADFAG